MPLERALVVVAALVAGLSLVKLMRNRQDYLTGLLRQHSLKQKEWAHKRAKAAALVRMAADQRTMDQRMMESPGGAIREQLGAEGSPFPVGSSSDSPSRHAPSTPVENRSNI